MPQAKPGTEAGFNTKLNFILGEVCRLKFISTLFGLALVSTD